MTDNQQRYPLHWPEGWLRSKTPKNARFGTKFTAARDGLLYEIQKLGGVNVVFSTNIELRGDGLPYANRKRPEDPGVAVYFTYKFESRVFACDRWNRVEDNIQAIRLTIEAVRGIERWGSSDMLDRVFRGFDALPAPASNSNESWWIVLGVDPDWPLKDIEQVYKNSVRIHHPDKGGSNEQTAKLNLAIDQARADKGR